MTRDMTAARAARAEYAAARARENEARRIKWRAWCKQTAEAFGRLQRARAYGVGLPEAEAHYKNVLHAIPPIPGDEQVEVSQCER